MNMSMKKFKIQYQKEQNTQQVYSEVTFPLEIQLNRIECQKCFEKFACLILGNNPEYGGQTITISLKQTVYCPFCGK